MNGFALYRLPHADHYVEIRQEGELLQLGSYAELGGISGGFVFAPFSVSRECPIVVIRGEGRIYSSNNKTANKTATDNPGSKSNYSPLLARGVGGEAAGTLTSAYAIDFANFHSRLLAGEFAKIVLARTETVPVSKSGERLFLEACARYPRMFIALVSTSLTGTWLRATPEPLLEKTAEGYHTVALAGTQQMGQGDWDERSVAWNDKNIMEQRLVATYITEQLEHFADHIDIDGPHTARAGELAHLRTNYRFTLSDDGRMGELIAALHPTPAVCGLPKDDTRRFILQNESAPRRYYSGFTGPLGIGGETHLYVTLRCMELHDEACTLYAGGGLLPGSQLRQEWDETVAKMETMKALIYDEETAENKNH